VLLPLIEIKSFALPLLNTYGSANSASEAFRTFCAGSDFHQLGTITAVVRLVVVPVIFFQTIAALIRGLRPFRRRSSNPATRPKQPADESWAPIGSTAD
jgi:hypothetical protein